MVVASNVHHEANLHQTIRVHFHIRHLVPRVLAYKEKHLQQ